MKQVALIEEAKLTLQQPLAARGYMLETKPQVRGHEDFWFEQKPSNQIDMYRIVEFQLREIDPHDYVGFAVNLCRRPFRDFDDDRNYDAKYSNRNIFEVRLAPCLWETEIEKKAMDFWWNFGKSVNELRTAYHDVLGKLLNYGIPFLENPDSNWWVWAGRSKEM